MNEHERDNLLLTMHTDIGVIKNKIEAIPDQEIRIRSLERFRHAFPGVAVVAVGISGIGIAINLL
jgi:hypothetical protein